MTRPVTALPPDLSLEEAMSRLGRSRSTIFRLVRAGILERSRSWHMTPRGLYVTRRSVEDVLAGRRIPSSSQGRVAS